jgi:hypothetical protein
MPKNPGAFKTLSSAALVRQGRQRSVIAAGRSREKK